MRINPILRNEIKIDSRQFRFFALLMFYVALMGVPILIFYYSICESYRIEAGLFVSMYMLLACMQAVVLMFIVPALTATAITGEREKQTLDILLTTKMTPRSIIWGKLLAAISKVILLIICTLPVYAIVLFLGGIRLSQIVAINLYLMMTTVCIGAICIWVSTRVKTSKLANVLAYCLELGIVIGWPILVMIVAVLNEDMFRNPAGTTSMNMDAIKYLVRLLCVSPAVGYGSLLGTQLGAEDGFSYFFAGLSIDLTFPGWGISILVQLFLTIVFVELAVRRLNPLKCTSKKPMRIKKASKERK